MSGIFYNRGKYRFINSAISGSTDLRCLVLAGASLPAGTKDPDLNTVADVLAVSGAVESTGVPRQDLASFAVAENDTTDKVDITAAAPTVSSVPTGETLRAIVYYIEGASDAARDLVAIDEPSSTQVTNGGDITLPAFTASV